MTAASSLLDTQALLGGVAVAGIWLAKEVASLVLREMSERRGALKYLAAGRRFKQDVQTSDGKSVDFDVWPTGDSPEHEYFDAVFYGSFVNGSGRPIIITSINITFWRTDGPKISHNSPYVQISGKSGVVQTIPARTSVNAYFKTSVRGNEMRSLYADSIPLLEVVRSDGQSMSFPLHINFWGDQLLRWNAKKRRVEAWGTYPRGFKTKPPGDDA